MTPSRQSQVLNWLRKNPKSFGFATELWKARRVAQVIERKFHVHINPRYLNEWLTARGITPQKPRTQPRERDDDDIRRWRRYQRPRKFKTRLARLKCHLVLIDESGVLLAPLVRRTLAPKGQTPILKHRAKQRDKVSLIAALSLSPRNQHLGLYFSTLINEHFESTAVAWFVRQLLKHLRGPLIVIWDRGNMHRGADIRQLQEDFPRLTLEFLPPYAPEFKSRRA